MHGLLTDFFLQRYFRMETEAFCNTYLPFTLRLNACPCATHHYGTFFDFAVTQHLLQLRHLPFLSQSPLFSLFPSLQLFRHLPYSITKHLRLCPRDEQFHLLSDFFFPLPT